MNIRDNTLKHNHPSISQTIFPLLCHTNNQYQWNSEAANIIGETNSDVFYNLSKIISSNKRCVFFNVPYKFSCSLNEKFVRLWTNERISE